MEASCRSTSRSVAESRPARAVHLDASIHAVGLHVSVPRHAGLGADNRQVFPTTHAIASRGMVLKGNGWSGIAPSPWPMALFTIVIIALAI
jgi:hypothetical protein